MAEFVEFYLWFDANNDGVAENIMLIADRTTRSPVFYDHVANVTTDGLRPIEIVRINPVEGRWYGQAPGIDGVTYLADGGHVKPGTIARARITQASDYDLAATLEV